MDAGCVCVCERDEGYGKNAGRAEVIKWISALIPEYGLPLDSSDEELRELLSDGTVLCRILNTPIPGVLEGSGAGYTSSEQRSDNVKKFLSVVADMGLPGFSVMDLEEGSMSSVVDCLLVLRDNLNPGVVDDNSQDVSKIPSRKKWRVPETDESLVAAAPQGKTPSGENRGNGVPYPKSQQKTPAFNGKKLREIFQLKRGSYADLPAAKISEMMHSNSLDNAPTQSLLTVINGILDESIERKKGEIPHRVVFLLRKVVQEIERRLCVQAEHIRNQNTIIKTREEKYLSKIKALQVLVNGTNEENQMTVNLLQVVKKKKKNENEEKSKIEERQKLSEQNVVQLIKEKENAENMIASLKEEMDVMEERNRLREKNVVKLIKEKESDKNMISSVKEKMEEMNSLHEQNVGRLMKEKEDGQNMISSLKEEMKEMNRLHEQNARRLIKEKEDGQNMISSLKEELEEMNKLHDQQLNRFEIKTKQMEEQLATKVKEFELHVLQSNMKIEEVETTYQQKSQLWNKKENIFHNYMNSQQLYVKGLNTSSRSIKSDMYAFQMKWRDEISNLGSNLKCLVDAADNYHKVLAENQKLFNEVQELRADVFSDTQPLIRSVLDGFNVCIFAYGQTGSGKTYTMKNAHVPYRNSKLTQVLQSSLGGQAKTLMFVQINPDVESYSETISTLKFAERVSGVELGAARSNKDGKDIKELLEQVSSLKDTISRKDMEIEQLQVMKDKDKSPSSVVDNNGSSMPNNFSSNETSLITLNQKRQLSDPLSYAEVNADAGQTSPTNIVAMGLDEADYEDNVSEDGSLRYITNSQIDSHKKRAASNLQIKTKGCSFEDSKSHKDPIQPVGGRLFGQGNQKMAEVEHSPVARMYFVC
ncbi:Kinesin-4 [Triticum urartu]|uniref:Kinesin-4 n=1 Tax=Triticum urartu TaxID=4572 RepID=M7ZGL1_TRIUA|nr:Kinesin-4 [Triticum urartu]